MKPPVAFAAVAAAGCLGFVLAHHGPHAAAAPPPAAASAAGCACAPKPVLPVALAPMAGEGGWTLNLRLLMRIHRTPDAAP
jgi:hypothetical protein